METHNRRCLYVDAYGWTSNMPKNGRKSRLWADILKHKEHSFNFTEFIVGDGKEIKCWVDGSCDSQPFAHKFPDIFVLFLKKKDV